MEKIWNLVLIIVGFVLVLTVIGFFAKNFDGSKIFNFRGGSSSTSSGSNISTNPIKKESCELSVLSLTANSKVHSPLKISGYADSRCGWQIKNGILGTVEMKSSLEGSVLGQAQILPIGDFKNGIVNFETNLIFKNNSDLNSGILVFSGPSSKGGVLTKTIPVSLYNGPIVKSGCFISGCFREKCTNQKSKRSFDRCEFQNEFACYGESFAVCEKQIDGECGWTQNSDLIECKASPN